MGLACVFPYLLLFVHFHFKKSSPSYAICFLLNICQALESKVNNTLDGHLRRQKEDIDKLKRECREGFSTVHESISNMKQVMDGKRKLLEEQLRKEIGQIRKMVVLI